MLTMGIRKYTRWLVAAALIHGVVLFGCGTWNEPAAESSQAAAEDAPPAQTDGRSPNAMPDFVLQDLDGATVRLSDYAGKAVFVNFWATWCGPCKAEIPDLVELQKQYSGDGFTIVGVSLDQTGVTTVRDFAQKNGLNYPVLMGNQQVVTQYGNFRGIPTSFLLNDKHEKVKQYPGMVPKQQLTADIEALLNGKA